MPGSNLKIENQNLTFLDGIIDSSNKTNPTCLCNGGTHTGIITNKKVEFHFKIINELISVCHMTEKVSRCQLDVKDL